MDKETKINIPIEEPPTTADISFEVGFKEKTRFNLRMITVAEETQVQMKFNDIADAEETKELKEYNICLDALIRFSVSGDGDRLRTRFADPTPQNERIVRAAYSQFKISLQPDIIFL